MSCNNYEYTFEGANGKNFTKQLCLKNQLTSSSNVDFPYEVIDGVKVYYLDSDVIINNDRYQTTMRYLFDDNDNPITKLTIKKTPNYSTSDYYKYGTVHGTESSSVYIKKHYIQDPESTYKKISGTGVPLTLDSYDLSITNIGLEDNKIFKLEKDGDKKYIMTNEDKSTSQLIVKDKDYYVNTCSYDSLNNQYYNFNGNTKDNLKILTPLDYTLIIFSVIFLIILIFQIYLLPIWLIWIFIILGVIAIALVWWLVPKYTCQHITDTIRYKVN